MIAEADHKYMQKAIDEAWKSADRNATERDPRVGAVIVNGYREDAAYRSEKNEGDHAEFSLICKKLQSSELLEHATLYTTLEPCTTRSHDKKPCVEWVIDSGIRRVVIGMLDPNPQICGRGYWRLLDAGVEIDFFPYELLDQLKDMNQEFVDSHRTPSLFNTAFASLIDKYKNAEVSQFRGSFGFLSNLELLRTPNRREGWPLSAVLIENDEKSAFSLPSELRGAYKSFFDRNYDNERLYDDGEKFMLVRNPTAWEEASTLHLKTRPTKYSVHVFYYKEISQKQHLVPSLIRQLVSGDLTCQFAHTLCLHLVIATSDNKLLLTQRSPKTGHGEAGLWSCSIEEQLHRHDIEAGPENAMLAWGKRTLREELSLDETAYANQNLRLLSVFAEVDHLNIALAAFAELNVDSRALDLHLDHRLGEIEFGEWEFIDFEPSLLLREIFKPRRRYHHSARYRLLLAYLKRFGQPEPGDLRRFGATVSSA
jgi:pyrimidine deaminase RibD-like protein